MPEMRGINLDGSGFQVLKLFVKSVRRDESAEHLGIWRNSRKDDSEQTGKKHLLLDYRKWLGDIFHQER